MHRDDEDGEDFDLDEGLKLALQDSTGRAKKRGNARKYEIRRHLEEMREKRLFHDTFDELD